MNALAMSDYVLGSSSAQLSAPRLILWIDSVGAYLVCLGSDLTIGGPGTDGRAADLPLLANLSRLHVTLRRSGERYVLYAHSPTCVAGRPVHDVADLSDGYELLLGDSVRLRFRLPNVLSGSVRVEFLSDHRPARAADGVVLLDDTCLLGPAADNHIRCPGWPQTVLLFRRDGRLHCKARDDLFIDGRHCPTGGELAPGSVVTGSEIRFRVEAWE
ncbi:MAG: FHA domain-containing protein [Planctomycetaceae bacterium]